MSEWTGPAAPANINHHLNSLAREIREHASEDLWHSLTALHHQYASDRSISARTQSLAAHCASRLAGLASQQRAVDKAVFWRRNALAFDPMSAERIIALAGTLISANEVAEAWAILSSLLGRNLSSQDSERLQSTLGRCAQAGAKLARARRDECEELTWRQRMIRLCPESHEHWSELARTFLRLRRLTDSWHAFNHAAKLVPPGNQRPLHLRRGIAQTAALLAEHLEYGAGPEAIEAADWNQAAQWRNEALRLDPSSLFWWRSYVRDLLCSKCFHEAGVAMAAAPTPEIAEDLRELFGRAPEILTAQTQGPSIYRSEAARYLVRGIPVIPALGKVAIPREWEELHDRLPTEEEHRRWTQISGANILLVLGRKSDVSVVDIDTDDPELIAIIRSLLPNSPWQRIGRRGMALAYRWSNIPKQSYRLGDTHKPLLDLLTSSAKILLPPSLHPSTGQPYRANTDLLDVVDDLPEIPQDFPARLLAALQAKGHDVRMAEPVRATPLACSVIGNDIPSVFF